MVVGNPNIIESGGVIRLNWESIDLNFDLRDNQTGINEAKTALSSFI